MDQSGGDRILDKVLSIPDGPQKAFCRARQLIERGQLSEVLRILDELEDDVGKMEISGRFSKTKKIFGGDQARAVRNGVRTDWADLTEEEHKRQSLLVAVTELRNKVTDAINGLQDLVVDIEATKADDVPTTE